MMEYYLLDIRTLSDPRVDAESLQGIPGWRCDYILRYARAEDRKRSLGAWQLMKQSLAKHGFSADDVTLDENGKLYCDDIYFNLSHSGDYVLCAVSDTPVGCDIERLKDAPRAVTKRIFTERERQYIAQAQTAEETNCRFFRLWTMKESYLKMTGEGLRFPMDRLEMDLAEGMVLRDSAPQPCVVQTTSYAGYIFSICYLQQELKQNA